MAPLLNRRRIVATRTVFQPLTAGHEYYASEIVSRMTSSIVVMPL